MSMKDPDIQKWLCKLKEGDESVFRKIFMHYADRFFLWTNHILKSPAAADSLVQEFFIRLWERRASLSFSDPSAFQAYAFRSLKNMSLNYIRDNEKLRFGYDIHVDVAEDQAVDPMAVEELYARLESAIEELPSRCKEIFKMAKIQKKSYGEIASSLGISENTVKVQVSKAYRILRNRMN